MIPTRAVLSRILTSSGVSSVCGMLDLLVSTQPGYGERGDPLRHAVLEGGRRLALRRFHDEPGEDPDNQRSGGQRGRPSQRGYLAPELVEFFLVDIAGDEIRPDLGEYDPQHLRPRPRELALDLFRRAPRSLARVEDEEDSRGQRRQGERIGTGA